MSPHLISKAKERRMCVKKKENYSDFIINFSNFAPQQDRKNNIFLSQTGFLLLSVFFSFSVGKAKRSPGFSGFVSTQTQWTKKKAHFNFHPEIETNSSLNNFVVHNLSGEKKLLIWIFILFHSNEMLEKTAENISGTFEWSSRNSPFFFATTLNRLQTTRIWSGSV